MEAPINRICMNLSLLVTLTLVVTNRGTTCVKDSPLHCDASSNTKSELIRTKMNVKGINASSFEEPFQDFRPLDICLTNGTLRIHWTINSTAGHEAKLCYEVMRVRNMNTVVIKCYKILVPQSYYTSELFCWFEIEHPEKNPYIHAIVTHRLNQRISYYYNELYVTNADVTKTCKHNICQEPLVKLKHKNLVCRSNNSIKHKEGVKIEQMIFNSTQCENLRLEFYRITENELDFYLNCSTRGSGLIHIIYSIHGRYCHIKFKTYLFCVTGQTNKGSSMHTTSLQLLQPQGTDYHEIALLTTVIIVSVLVTSVSIKVVLVIRRQRPRTNYVRSRTIPPDTSITTHVMNNTREFDRLRTDNDEVEIGTINDEDGYGNYESFPLSEFICRTTNTQNT